MVCVCLLQYFVKILQYEALNFTMSYPKDSLYRWDRFAKPKERVYSRSQVRTPRETEKTNNCSQLHIFRLSH